MEGERGVVVWNAYSISCSGMLGLFKDCLVCVYALLGWELKKEVVGKGWERWSSWGCECGSGWCLGFFFSWLHVGSVWGSLLYWRWCAGGEDVWIKGDL